MKKLELLYTFGGTINGAIVRKVVGSFLKKINIELLYDRAIPFLNIYLKELKVES